MTYAAPAYGAAPHDRTQGRAQGRAAGASTAAGRAPRGWAARPRYSAGDVAAMLWRERFLALAVFLALSIAGVLFALTFRTTYPAQASILVRLGQEYVYDPRVGDAGRGVAPELSSLVQSEIAILSSDSVRQAAIQAVGIERVSPELGRAYAAAAPARKPAILAKAIRQVGQATKVAGAPQSNVITISYKHRDPAVSAAVLNKMVEEYLARRRALLSDPTAPLVDAQRRSFQERLDQADTAYRSFLATNSIGDFEASKTALNQQQANLEDESLRVEARLNEISGRLGELTRLGRQTPAEIGLYRDSSVAIADRLLTARLERAELLSRYRPESTPVREVDAKIARLEALRDGGGADAGAGAVRTGLNPVYQTIQTEQVQLSAERRALVDRAATLSRQLGEVSARRQQLTDLEPQYQDIVRDREVLQSQVRDLSVRAQQSEAAGAIGKGADNVQAVERAATPTQGKSLKKPVAAAAVLFALLTALCAALARAFLRPGFPSAGAVERTLGLPVLTQAPAR